MKHKRCGGYVYKDTVVPEFDFYELSCMMCGHRWYPSRDSAFGLWLSRNNGR